MIEFQSVHKRFGATVALEDLSFRVAPGSITGLLGPNGSGKTTTLRLILNLFRADRGSIRVLGAPPSESTSDRIGYLPEERGLYRRMTVRDVIAYYAALKGHAMTAAELGPWLSRFGIESYLRSPIDRLSKGTAQKVQFIAAAIHRPQLLILDEPFSGLDPMSAASFRETLTDLHRSGTTLILSTHDMTLAENLCDHFLMISRGRKVLDQSRAGLGKTYGEPTVKVACVGPVPRLAGVTELFTSSHYSELGLLSGTDPQAVLRELSQKAEVQRFEISRPSLSEIFMRLARE